MLAEVREEKRRHFCHEEKLSDDEHFRNSLHEFLDQQSMIVDFTSEPEKLSEAAGLSFEQHTPKHLRGLKDFEIEFLLKNRNSHRCKR